MRKFFCLLIVTCLLLAGCSGTAKVRSLMEKGEEALETGSYEEAAASYSEAIRLNGKLSLAYNNRGLCYLQMEEYEKAAQDFEKAGEMDSMPEYYGNLGACLLKMGDPEGAIDAYTQAIRTESRDPDYYRGRAEAYAAAGESKLAISDYTQVLALDPDDGAAYNNRGVQYLHAEDYEKAAVDFALALEKSPESEVQIRRNIAENYRAQGQADLAAEEYLRMAEIEDRRANSMEAMNLYLGADRYPEAINVLRDLYEQDPNDMEALGILADLLYTTAQYSEAVPFYTALLEQEPNSLYYGERADCYLKLGDMDLALEDLNKALELDPDYGWAYYMRGEIYLEKEEFEKADADFARAEELSYEETDG